MPIDDPFSNSISTQCNLTDFTKDTKDAGNQTPESFLLSYIQEMSGRTLDSSTISPEEPT